MDFTYPQEAEQFRKELRAWPSEQLTGNVIASRFRRGQVAIVIGCLGRALADDVAGRLSELAPTHLLIVSGSMVDEVLDVCERCGISAMPGYADVGPSRTTKK